jgi:predicted transposase/invertase (TIGR01784 family)
MEGKPKQFKGKLFDRLFEIARISKFNSEELAEYEANRMNMLDYNASMKFARKEGVAFGEARGEARGIALGRNEGFTLGEARGVAIGETKGILQTARKMKAKGFNIAVICEITGLSEIEIERLD